MIMEDDSYFEDEEFSPIRSLLGLLTFSTILPIRVYTSIEYMTKLTWCWPFLHIFIGILAAACGYVALNFLHLNTFFTAVIVYAFLMIITGYNHLDGVMDMADGVMVHGAPERKIRVMKDPSVGAGGVFRDGFGCFGGKFNNSWIIQYFGLQLHIRNNYL